MSAILNDHLTPKRAVLAGLGMLLIALCVMPWLPTYAPISQSLTSHYLEARGRLPTQIQQRETEQRRADEESKRRTDENERQQQLSRQFASYRNDFQNIARPRNDAIAVLLRNVNAATKELKERANKPVFYRESGLRPEETSTDRSCSDPANTMDLFNRTNRREQNVYACAVYLAAAPDASNRTRNVTVALLQRITFPQYIGYYPFQTIVAYVWIDKMASALRRGEAPPPLPAMMAGEDFNPAIFADVLTQGFARLLIDSASAEEKLDFSRMTYPELKKLAEASSSLLLACQASGRSNCLGN